MSVAPQARWIHFLPVKPLAKDVTSARMSFVVGEITTRGPALPFVIKPPAATSSSPAAGNRTGPSIGLLAVRCKTCSPEPWRCTLVKMDLSSVSLAALRRVGRQSRLALDIGAY